MRRKVTYLTTAAGVLVLASLGLVCKDSLIEQWHIFRLSSEDEATRLHAVERLVELKSVRAVPHFLRLIEADEREFNLTKLKTIEAGEWKETLYRVSDGK